LFPKPPQQKAAPEGGLLPDTFGSLVQIGIKPGGLVNKKNWLASRKLTH